MKKILIIEDQAAVRRLVRMTLELDDYEIFEAADGDGGLALAMDIQPDLVLLSAMLPGSLSGLDVCRILDTWWDAPKVVLLTARGRSQDLEAGLAAGADACLVKPFTPLQLMENIHQQCEMA